MDTSFIIYQKRMHTEGHYVQSAIHIYIQFRNKEEERTHLLFQGL